MIRFGLAVGAGVALAWWLIGAVRSQVRWLRTRRQVAALVAARMGA